jgi:hypothetical protein
LFGQPQPRESSAAHLDLKKYSGCCCCCCAGGPQLIAGRCGAAARTRLACRGTAKTAGALAVTDQPPSFSGMMANLKGIFATSGAVYCSTRTFASVALIPNGAAEVRVGSGVGPGVGPGVVPPSLPPTGPVILLARSSLHCKGLEHDALSSLPSDLLAVSLKTPKAPRQCQVLGRSRRRAPRPPRSAGKWRAMAGARIR